MGPITETALTITHSQLPDGVQDRFLAEAVRRRQVEQRLRDCFTGWGYTEVIPPTFEYYDNLSVGAGQRLQQAMYRFFDQRGRTLALRADFTPQIARIAATKLFDQPMPLRLCYLGSLFRAEEPQAGRQREFTQAGVELVGAGTPAADAEVVALAAAAIEALGIDGFQINLGQMAFFRALTGDLPREALASIRDAIDHKNRVRLAEATAGLDEGRRTLLQRLPDLVGGPEVVDEARGLAAAVGPAEAALGALERLVQVHARLVAWGVAGRIVLDLGEVRGMDYYTGITFRGVAPGLGWPLVSGGRYDDLIAHFGRPMPAVGMGLSVGRALLVGAGGEVGRLAADVLVHACSRGDCLVLVQALRKRGCRVKVDVLGLDDAGLAEAARQRGIPRTLRCTGDGWRLADGGEERVVTRETLLCEVGRWRNGQGGAR
ncbi:MAG: ATP phosphoribosyltransferase regulatory subunit [Anaerolineae bacterium]|nr:ATP phosphoribosyltransferase regulatory subunit [Anaerolineae bacterium]